MEKAMAPYSSTLAWKIPWMEEPGGLQSMGLLRVRHDWTTSLSCFTFMFHFHALEKEMATHSSVLAWRIPGSGEPGGLLSMGSHRVGHDWSDLAAAAAAAAWISQRVLTAPAWVSLISSYCAWNTQHSSFPDSRFTVSLFCLFLILMNHPLGKWHEKASKLIPLR